MFPTRRVRIDFLCHFFRSCSSTRGQGLSEPWGWDKRRMHLLLNSHSPPCVSFLPFPFPFMVSFSPSSPSPLLSSPSLFLSNPTESENSQLQPCTPASPFLVCSPRAPSFSSCGSRRRGPQAAACLAPSRLQVSGRCLLECTRMDSFPSRPG